MNNYKIPGIQKQTVKTAGVRALTAVGLIKPPKVRKQRESGYKCDRQEDRIRKEIVIDLRKRGWNVRRVEPAFRGEFSLGDLYVWRTDKKIMAWIEVKSPTGSLSEGQKEFQMACFLCGVRYHVVTSIEEAVLILG